MSTFWRIVCIVLAIVIIGSIVFFSATPTGRKAINRWKHSLQKADDETLYETRKKVEDTCRSMISQYTADKLKYETYSSNGDQELATAAKIRANDTAATYNNYILKNKYVWEGNVPEDIKQELPYIE
jgi:uncharacterized protein YpmS